MPAKRYTGKKSGARSAPPAKADLSASVHLVFGEDEYLVGTAAKELVDKLCPPADQDFGLETIEGRVDNAAEAVAAVNSCIGALQTVGLLGGRKVVWLKDANFLGATQVGRAQDVKDGVEKLVGMVKAGLAEEQVLVVSTAKLDRRQAFFKTFQSGGSVMEFGIPEKSYQAEQQAKETAASAFRKAGLSVDRSVIEEFMGKVGADTRQIVNEIEKLKTYLGDRSEVRVSDVRDVVSSSREAIAWDFADAVGNRNVERALRVLRQLLFQGENVVGLIFGLERRFREIVFYRECLDRRWIRVSGDEPWLKVSWKSGSDIDAVMESFEKDPRKGNPYRTGRLVAQARKWTVDAAVRCQKTVVAEHERLFSSGLPNELLLEFLVLRLLGRKTEDGRRKTLK